MHEEEEPSRTGGAVLHRDRLLEKLTEPSDAIVCVSPHPISILLSICMQDKGNKQKEWDG